MENSLSPLRRFWRGLRAWSGDDAYERYLDHARAQHPDAPLLDRKTYYRMETERRWNGVRRCC